MAWNCPDCTDMAYDGHICTWKTIERLSNERNFFKSLLKELIDEAEYPQPCTLDGGEMCKYHAALEDECKTK